MAKKKFKLVNTLMWVVGLLVTLAVGSGMISKVLSIPFIPSVLTVVAGWIIVIGAILGALMSIFKQKYLYLQVVYKRFIKLEVNKFINTKY